MAGAESIDSNYLGKVITVQTREHNDSIKEFTIERYRGQPGDPTRERFANQVGLFKSAEDLKGNIPREGLVQFQLVSGTYEVRNPGVPGVYEDWTQMRFTPSEAEFLNSLNLRPAIIEKAFAESASTKPWEEELADFLSTVADSRCFNDTLILIGNQCDDAREFIRTVYDWMFTHTSEIAYMLEEEQSKIEKLMRDQTASMESKLQLQNAAAAAAAAAAAKPAQQPVIRPFEDIIPSFAIELPLDTDYASLQQEEVYPAPIRIERVGGVGANETIGVDGKKRVYVLKKTGGDGADFNAALQWLRSNFSGKYVFAVNQQAAAQLAKPLDPAAAAAAAAAAAPAAAAAAAAAAPAAADAAAGPGLRAAPTPAPQPAAADGPQ
jgi:hypothetical protein